MLKPKTKDLLASSAGIMQDRYWLVSKCGSQLQNCSLCEILDSGKTDAPPMKEFQSQPPL